VTVAGIVGAALILAGINLARILESRPAAPTLQPWQA
jgi:hypothetical protein